MLSGIEGTTPGIDTRELYPLPSIDRGIFRLKRAIYDGPQAVFCICAAARDFHVGAKDAEDIFSRAVNRSALQEVGEKGRSETLYVAVRSGTERAPSGAAQDEARDHIERAYATLEAAYPSYRRGLHLLEQGDEIYAMFIEAFRRLVDLGILPLTAGNAQFSHQGMVLLMERCFPTNELLVRYLQNPKVLTAPEYCVAAQ